MGAEYTGGVYKFHYFRPMSGYVWQTIPGLLWNGRENHMHSIEP